MRWTWLVMMAAACDPGVAAPQDPASWERIKRECSPEVRSIGFGEARPLEPRNAAWEDGLHISRDGLTLYCIYSPADLLGQNLSGDGLEELHRYRRGPDLGMDFANPAGEEWPWVQADIAIAERASTDEPFGPWRLSRLARPVFSEGAPQILNAADGSIEWFVYTSNDTSNHEDDIVWIRGADRDPSGAGTPIPAPVTTEYVEDNPHLERADDGTLVLFFDSNNRPGGPGAIDIWFATSMDDGATWSEARVADVSGEEDQTQPHLYCDGGVWRLYYTEALDGRYTIVRARQAAPGDWEHWVDREVVIEPGGAAAVGEPTLTAEGDLAFVVLLENPGGGRYDRFDCDPWIALRRR